MTTPNDALTTHAERRRAFLTRTAVAAPAIAVMLAAGAKPAFAQPYGTVSITERTTITTPRATETSRTTTTTPVTTTTTTTSTTTPVPSSTSRIPTGISTTTGT